MLDSVGFDKNVHLDDELKLKYFFSKVRDETVSVCQQVELEDLTVQPFPEVSPAKWHLGHTTWFFEEFVLAKYVEGYQFFNEKYRTIFNSYYKQVGDHWEQRKRGVLSRPTVAEVLEYRAFVDKGICNLDFNRLDKKQIGFLLNSGLQHEQQHQELLYMDLKSVLAANSLEVSFSKDIPAPSEKREEAWSSFSCGLYEVGFDGSGFSYDNELPKHKHYLQPFEISNNCVTNGEFLNFIKNKGYERPEFWLSKGWDWQQMNQISHPLYWSEREGVLSEYTLYGWRPLELNSPLTHISYYEADAFSKWLGVRLPTEQEFEVFQKAYESGEGSSELKKLHPNDSSRVAGQVWCWTQSHYSPYPGYKSFDGKLAEYNGKFMCGQFVLRGGCVVTPVGHSRYSYRNFYEPHQRWMFSGIRVARAI